MSQEESDVARPTDPQSAGVPEAAAAEPDASHLEEGLAGTPVVDTGAHPAGAPVAQAAPAGAEGQAQTAMPSAAEVEARVREEVRSELAGELSALQQRVSQLEAELSTERERATDYMNKWQRTQADFSNFRRRNEQDQKQIESIAAAQAMALVLPALDSFERAFKTLPESLQRFTWIDGIALIDLQLRRVLQTRGVEPFEPGPGEAHDPQRHEAIGHAETDEYPEGTVVEVLQRGYELHGRALRPALVRLARPSAERPAEAAPTSDASAGGAEGEGPSRSGEAPHTGGSP